MGLTSSATIRALIFWALAAFRTRSVIRSTVCLVFLVDRQHHEFKGVSFRLVEEDACIRKRKIAPVFAADILHVLDQQGRNSELPG